MSESKTKEAEQKRLVMLEYRISLLNKLLDVSQKAGNKKLDTTIDKLLKEIESF